MSAPTQERLERLEEKFRWFAQEAERLGSPLWKRVSLLIAGEPRLLALANEARPGVQQPNMVLSAFHYLLLDSPTPPKDLIAAMSDAAIVSFLVGHEDQIRALITERLVQTNEVRRCALFLPAFVEVAARRQKPLALVEVGTSAGLLLGFDRYAYRYEPGGRIGDAASPVVLECELRGEGRPALSLDIEVASRVGIDLHPVRHDNSDDVKWLRSLIWPEHDERQERLAAALAVTADNPPDLREGDAFDLLPSVVAEAPADATVVVFHCMTMAHMSRPQRERFPEMLAELAAQRDGDLSWIACEWVETDSLFMTSYDNDRGSQSRRFANVNPHGAWLEWLGS